MKKVIVKSVTITLVLILLLSTIISVVLCLFFPKTISNLSFKIGNYDLAVTYSEKSYQKDPSVENLVDLVEKSIIAKNNAVTCKYAGVLLVDDNFREDILPNKELGYLNYIASSYVKALYYSNDYEKCVKSAVNYTNYNERSINPTTTLISICAEDNNKPVLNMLLNELNLLASNEIIEEYKLNVNTILQN
ncbi:MAG: hypothetical protein IJW26_01645 [Clostridia bacterium]|nr:hypothetical protein [Clostridia bacterium]